MANRCESSDSGVAVRRQSWRIIDTCTCHCDAKTKKIKNSKSVVPYVVSHHGSQRHRGAAHLKLRTTNLVGDVEAERQSLLAQRGDGRRDLPGQRRHNHFLKHKIVFCRNVVLCRGRDQILPGVCVCARVCVCQCVIEDAFNTNEVSTEVTLQVACSLPATQVCLRA